MFNCAEHYTKNDKPAIVFSTKMIGHDCDKGVECENSMDWRENIA